MTIVTRNVEYAAPDGVPMEGTVAYDEASSAPRPGVLIAHDWMGVRDFTRQKAQQLAQDGYAGFAVDIYGKGHRPKDKEEARALLTKYKGNRALLRAHMRAAFDALAAMPQVDAARIVAMGYCFGGTAALELARSGAPLAGTASFHGGLSTPHPEDAKNIHGPVLVMHGADDPSVPPSDVQSFKEEMRHGGVRLQFIAYPGAVHGFTHPDAGDAPSTGKAYNAAADKASWQSFCQFMRDVTA